MDVSAHSKTKKPPPPSARRTSQGAHQPGLHNAQGSNTDFDNGISKKMRLQSMPSPGILPPVSSAPNTPNPRSTQSMWGGPAKSRRQSTQALPSPLDRSGAATPLKSPDLRRTNSSLNMRASATPSPGGSRKGSRSSLGAYDENGSSDRKLTPKRSISNLISELKGAQTKMEPIEEPKHITANDIASAHFSRLLTHQDEENVETECAVILHDACFGHRFSRPKSSKSHLSMIVERPERLTAVILGAANAYVRMGQHYAGGDDAPHPSNTSNNRPPFTARRTKRKLDITSSYVTNVHGTSWMTELVGMCNKTAARLAAGEKELSRSRAEVEKEQLHEGDLYLCPESLDAFQGALGGVAEAIDLVFSPTTSTKRAFVGIRPPGHHCSADYPSGFCWLNNVHIGIEYACQDYGLTHAVILDFDLHHGDGSQTITWARNKKNEEKRWDPKRLTKQRWNPEVGYYSLHDINSYPCEDGDDAKVQAASICVDNAHGQSVWNVHLEPWKSEAEFWRIYEEKYSVLLDKARAFLKHHTKRLRGEGNTKPCGAVFVSAGFDASEWEGGGMQRHKVNVPTEFYARFTRDIVSIAEDPTGGCEGRLVSVLEGGYSDRALCSGVLSHLSGLCFNPLSPINQTQDKRDDIAAAMNSLSLSGLASNYSITQKYDREWWSEENLKALETQVLPPPPPPPGKKHRTGPQPTYATPTESFAYKVRDSDKFARSIAGTMRDGPAITRSKTPPPPEVDWVTATQELHKLLVPVDRETRSHTVEDLAPVRTKKERQSAMAELGSAAGEIASKPATRQLRERTSKAPAKASARRAAAATPYAESATSDETVRDRSTGRIDRRSTIADFTPAKDVFDDDGPIQTESNGRLSGIKVNSTPMDSVQVPKPTTATNDGAMRPPPLPRTTSSSSVHVKKARVAPVAPKTIKPPSGMVSSSSLAKQASNGTASNKTLSALSGEETVDESITREVERPKRVDSSSNGSLDALATGMKKITLKVGTREESERKVREKQEAEVKIKEAERKARAVKAAETRKRNAEAKKAGAVGNAPGSIGGVKPSSSGLVGSKTSSKGPGPSRLDAVAKRPTYPVQPDVSMTQNSGVNAAGLNDASVTLPEWARLATNQLADAIPAGPVANPLVDSKIQKSSPDLQVQTQQPAAISTMTDFAPRYADSGQPTSTSTRSLQPQAASDAAEQPLHLPSSPIMESPRSPVQDQHSSAISTSGSNVLPARQGADTLTASAPSISSHDYSIVKDNQFRSVSRGRESLPTFSSTGFIPFAQTDPTNSNLDASSQEQQHHAKSDDAGLIPGEEDW